MGNEQADSEREVYVTFGDVMRSAQDQAEVRVEQEAESPVDKVRGLCPEEKRGLGHGKLTEATIYGPRVELSVWEDGTVWVRVPGFPLGAEFAGPEELAEWLR